MTGIDESALNELLGVFLLDAPRRLVRVERRLVDLRASDPASDRSTAIADAALEAHSLRGAAGTLQLETLGELAERLELTLRELGANGDDRALLDRARELLGSIASEVARLEREREAVPLEDAAAGSRPTILQVEDDPVNVRLIERALARRPEVRLVTATRVDEGLELARTERPALILLDLHLPDASGREFLSRLRADPATSGLDVVVVTADGYAEGDESLHSLGVREHLTKPIDVGRLLELVDSLAPSPPRPGNGGHAFRDREIVEAVPHGIALLDLDGLVLDVNPATEQLLGLRRHELIGRSCLPFTHPEDHAKEQPFLSAVLRGESDGYTLEKRYVRSDGEAVWARLDLRVILDEAGAPLRLLALIEDVRERRRHDEEQRRLSEQISTILECVTDGFVALDRDWRYTYVNERAGELLGRRPADLVGKNIWEEFPEAVDQPFHDAYQRAMTEQTTVFLEEHYGPWDRWFETRVYGSRTGLAIYFTDVTERRRVEEAERRQRERADALREVNEALTSTLDLHEMLGVLLDSLKGVVPYTTAGVLLLGEDEPLVAGALRGDAAAGDDVAPRLVELGASPHVRRVLDDGHTVLVHDTDREPAGRALFAPGSARSWFAVPLRAGGEVIGLCAVESSAAEAFDEGDVDWAEALTAHATAAIENARLHDQLLRRAGELERRLGELAEAQRVAHVGSFEWDKATNRVTWSDELYRICGLDPASFTARFETFVERIHPDDRETVGKTIQSALAERRPFRMQVRIVRPSGEIRHLATWGEVVDDDQFRPSRLLGICHDVTEEHRRRERVEVLRDANDALTRTLDLEEVVGVLLDSLTSFVRSTSASVLLLNDESQLVIGALRGYGERDGAHTSDHVGAVGGRPIVRRILEQRETVVVSDAERDADGRPLLARADVRSWIGVPLRAAGHVIGLCAVESSQAGAFGPDDVDWAEALTAQAAAAIENARLHDQLRRHASELEQRVTERTQDLHAAKEDAESANRAKNDFLAGISHELRTPINAILGFAQLLELDGLEGDQEDNVRQILRAGRHLLELITELLDIARIEAGELALSLEAVGLEHLLVEAVDLTRPIAEQYGVTMSVCDEAGGYLFADRQRVLQVLLNLLANAAKYNRRGGSIDVVCTESPGGRVAIAVRDTGAGIEPANLERLFAPFERLGHEQGSIEGVGLGLTLVQRLVHAMSGTISVESTPGAGSTFTVELPRADDPLAALADDALASSPRARAATVLYIEDNRANLQLVERALARLPELTVLTATLGRLGLDLAREHRPDVILLDLHLPDVSGEDVLEQLSSSPETEDIPVVIVSAAASRGRVRMLHERGAYDYLTKPIDLTQLVEVVNSALGDRRRAQSSG